MCHTRYEDTKYLSPDHRIPAIVEAENLTDSNFKEKLMTLCTFCNQRKREFTKKVPVDYDWLNSPWAYPEKFQQEKIIEEIKMYSLSKHKTVSEVLQEITEAIESKIKEND